MEKLQRLEDLNDQQRKSFPLFIILLVYLGITPLFDAGFDHDVMYWLVLLAMPVLLILTFRDKPGLRINFSDPGFYLVLFVIWSGLSFIWSIHQLRTVIEWIQLLTYAIAYFAMRNLDDEFKDKALRIGSITAVILAFYGIIQFILIASQRVQATFTNPNPFGTYLAMYFLFLWANHLRDESRMGFASSVIILTAIVLSGSRGTYLAILVTSPIVYWGLPKTKVKQTLRQTIKLALMTTASVAFIFFLTPLIQAKVKFGTNFLESLIRMNSFNTSTSARLQFWRAAWKLILDRPLTGFGYGSFFASHYIEYQVGDVYSRFVHNHYLQLAAELGLPGLILFGLFCLLIFKNAFLQIKRSQAYLPLIASLAAFTVFLCHVFIEFSWNFPAVPIVFFAMAGVFKIENRVAVSESKANEKTTPRNRSSYMTAAIWVLIFLLVASLFTSFRIIDRGLQAANNGDYESAIHDLKLSYQLAPYSSPNRSILSEIYIRKYQESLLAEDLQQAINYAEQSVEMVPYSGKDHHWLANLYVMAKQVDLAEPHYQSAIRYNAYELGAFIDYANVCLSQSRIADAQTVLLDGSTRIATSLASVPLEEPLSRFAVFQKAIAIQSTLAKLYSKNGDLASSALYEQLASELNDKYEQAKVDYEKILKEQA